MLDQAKHDELMNPFLPFQRKFGSKKMTHTEAQRHGDKENQDQNARSITYKITTKHPDSNHSI